MKIIFLDFDGVLSCIRVLSWYNLDIYAVNFLLWICRAAQVKIVISSTWRKNNDEQFFKNIFGEHLHEDWRTGVSENRNRGLEIDTWMQKHLEVTNYLIIDDDTDMMDKQMSHLVLTDPLDGMLYKHQMEIRDHFKIKGWPKEIKELFQCKEMFATFNIVH